MQQGDTPGSGTHKDALAALGLKNGEEKGIK